MNYIVFGYWYPNEDILLVGLNNYHKDDYPVNEDDITRFDLNKLRNLISKDNTKNFYNVGMQNNSIYKKNNTYQSFLGFDINKHLTFTNSKLFNVNYCLGTIETTDGYYKIGITTKSKIWLFCNAMTFAEQQKEILNLNEIKYCMLNPKIFNLKKENNNILTFIEESPFTFKNGIISFENEYERRGKKLNVNLVLEIKNSKLSFKSNNLSNAKNFIQNFIFYNGNYQIIDSNCKYFINNINSNNKIKLKSIKNNKFNLKIDDEKPYDAKNKVSSGPFIRYLSENYSLLDNKTEYMSSKIIDILESNPSYIKNSFNYLLYYYVNNGIKNKYIYCLDRILSWVPKKISDFNSPVKEVSDFIIIEKIENNEKIFYSIEFIHCKASDTKIPKSPGALEEVIAQAIKSINYLYEYSKSKNNYIDSLVEFSNFYGTNNKSFTEMTQIINEIKTTQPDKIKHTISIYYPRFELKEELSKNYISNFQTILEENNIY